MPRVIISAGHTDSDPGTSSLGLREVDLTRAIARHIIPYLRFNGIITLSVPPNLDLASRIEWINGTGYNEALNDIAIELHINDGKKSGFEFWYKGQGGNLSQTLAEKIMETVTVETGLPSQGVKSEHEHEFTSLAFINSTNTISVILECLYIDNPEDNSKLKNENEVDKIAKGIAKGVINFLGLEYKETPSASNMQTQPSPPTHQGTFQQQQIGVNARQVLNRNMPQSYSQYAGEGIMPNFNPQQPPQMTREQRQEMIIALYQRILGRNPSPNDLNYFLNIGITPEKLIERMINSQEHYDTLKIKNKFFSIREEYEKQRLEVIKLREEVKDNKIIVSKLTELLKQKNAFISRFKNSPSIPQSKSNSEEGKGKKKNYKGTFADRFFHFFSDILG